MTGVTTLQLERVDAVQWIRLDRPQARNAIDVVMREELIALLTELDADDAVRAIVVTGQGADFCTGADLAPSHDPGIAARRPTSVLDYRRAPGPWQRLFRTYWELETPVVSAVNGTTAGSGWMLALLADLVVAAEGARWIHAFARRGMVPHAGDPFFLPDVLPWHGLLEAALLSETLTSETLHAWGAVNRLVPPADVERTAGELATRLAAGPTKSLGVAKQLYRRALVSDMATAFAEEAAATALVSQTHDRIEGVQSLLDGRRPDFTGT
ncbi:MAG TPA: enoyl-CoA hydratase/isomerase family protein [Acidimicrobiia bacterium]|jgi:2-(1,2-epoxy-1,2-dihydrophenyl)acetyl-CoA isomerase